MKKTESSGQINLRVLSDLRADLEIFAVRQICIQSPGKQTVSGTLGPILTRLREAARKGDHKKFMQADYDFHSATVRLAGLPVLHTIWQTVWEQLAGFHHDSFARYWPDLRVLLYEHEYLLDAVCSFDMVSAEDAVQSHLQAIWFRLAEQRGEMDQSRDPLERAIAYLTFHLHQAVRLNDVANKVAFTSAGYLSKLFRERYGQSFQLYLQTLRLNKASQLLTQTPLPVATIARRVGYRDVSRFGQHFSRRFGKTPRQWRNTRA